MRWFLVLVIIVLGIFSVILFKKSYQEIRETKIGVSIFPFYDLVKEIVKDKFEVVLIIPPGAQPHNYELSPEDLRKIQGIKIVFHSGTDIDAWLVHYLKNEKKAKLVSLAEGIELLKINNQIDPHYWLSIERMKKISQKIEKEMENIDPKNKDFYQRNWQGVLNKLDELSKLAKENTKNLKSRYLITQHQAFNYLIQELNLVNLASLEGPNKEITPKELSNLIEKIRLLKIKVIFKEPGKESNLLKTIAQNFKLEIYELDPIEGLSGLNYFDSYKKNIEVLKEALNK